MAVDADDIAFAGRLADAAAAIVLRYFRTGVAVDDKADASPVTVADRAAEEAMRNLIAKERPHDGIIGEEYGREHRLRDGTARPVRTRACATLDKATLYCSSPLMFKENFPAFERVRTQVKLPMYGGDCYAYGLVASGYADLDIEAGLGIYDYVAVVPVLAGAGGLMTDWQGKQLTLASDGRVVAAGDSHVHAAAIAALAG